jgi:hypothetical protein
VTGGEWLDGAYFADGESNDGVFRTTTQPPHGLLKVRRVVQPPGALAAVPDFLDATSGFPRPGDAVRIRSHGRFRKEVPILPVNLV